MRAVPHYRQASNNNFSNPLKKFEEGLFFLGFWSRPLLTHC
jgi:hypothetical protein